MAGDSPSESVASQVRAARKLSPDGTKAIYDLTSGVDFSKPKRTARAIAQVLWEEDVQSWWTWRGAGPAFHPTRKVELRLPSGHDRSWPDGSRSSTLRVGWKAGPAPLHVHQDWTSSSHRTCAIARAVLFGLEKSTPEVKS